MPSSSLLLPRSTSAKAEPEAASTFASVKFAGSMAGGAPIGGISARSILAPPISLAALMMS